MACCRALPNYRYVNQQGSDLYPHSGGIIDYAFDAKEIYAFTFEGRGEVRGEKGVVHAW